MKIQALAAIAMALTMIVVRADETAPRDVLTSFFSSLKEGKTAAALSNVFIRPGREQIVEARLGKLAEKAKTAALIQVIEIKEAGTIARAIVKDSAKNTEGKTDYDGAVLLKRDNKWKIVLSVSEVEDTPGVITVEEKKEIPGLWKWQEETMTRFQTE